MTRIRIYFICVFGLAGGFCSGQNIRMYWPKFAGKTYDFIIFEGDKYIKARQDTIPADGRFVLSVPPEYAPYTGMCRWLITGSAQGGGLDMVIPGRDFSVSCAEAVPDEGNITYEGYDPVNELNRLHNDQQRIIDRYAAMQQAMKAFAPADANYRVFEQESKIQQEAYDGFQARLRASGSYASRYLRIVNITKGFGTRLEKDPWERGRNIVRYMADELDWGALYTSGHWTQVISSWVEIHARVVKDPWGFAEDFAKIGDRIADKRIYTDFAGRTAYFLTKQGADDLIGRIAQQVVNSGKIEKYEGSLLVYTTGAEGTQAPDLLLPGGKGVSGGQLPDKEWKGSELAAGGDYQKALLVFYEAGCPGCEELLAKLLAGQELLKSNGIRVVAISADQDEATFEGRSASFPWKDTFCDLKGMNGVNFRRYGVVGTPTVFVIGKSGRIERRLAGLPDDSALSGLVE